MQHRHVFNNSKNMTRLVVEIVHTGLCGPLQNSAIGFSRYFVLLKDGLSHYGKVFFFLGKPNLYIF